MKRIRFHVSEEFLSQFNDRLKILLRARRFARLVLQSWDGCIRDIPKSWIGSHDLRLTDTDGSLESMIRSAQEHKLGRHELFLQAFAKSRRTWLRLRKMPGRPRSKSGARTRVVEFGSEGDGGVGGVQRTSVEARTTVAAGAQNKGSTSADAKMAPSASVASDVSGTGALAKKSARQSLDAAITAPKAPSAQVQKQMCRQKRRMQRPRPSRAPSRDASDPLKMAKRQRRTIPRRK